MPNVEDFRFELRSQLAAAVHLGAPAIEITSGTLHRKVGDYPGTSHAMPSCCQAMYSEMRQDDMIVAAPAKGKGATLTVRYQLPR